MPARGGLGVEDHGSIARFRAALAGGAAQLKAETKLASRAVGREALGTIRSSASSTMPHSGGLASKIAGSRFTLTASPGKVRIRATNPYYLERIDRGIVEHLVYGHRPLVMQRVTPGWFTRPARATEPFLRIRLTRVTDRVATSIRRSL